MATTTEPHGSCPGRFNTPAAKNTYTRAEVALHNRPNDLWVIIHGKVYDVTKWAAKHPGGSRIIRHSGGEDVSVSFTGNYLLSAN